MNKTLKTIIYLLITAAACFWGAEYCISKGDEKGAWYFYIFAAFSAMWIFQNAKKSDEEREKEKKEREERRRNRYNGPKLPG